MKSGHNMEETLKDGLATNRFHKCSITFCML